MVAQEKEIYLAVLITVSFLATFLIFFAFNLLINQRKVRKLQKSLVSAEIMTLENERRRFASDIHDEIAPGISVAVSLVDSLTVPEEDQERKDMALHVLRQSVQQIRLISRNIIPRYIQEQGLEKSIQNLVYNIRQAMMTPADIKLDIQAVPLNLTEDKMINIYRIVQESLNNSIKHSGAREIRVHMSIRNNTFLVIISDNGKGFDFSLPDLSKPTKDSGIGLKNIHNRVTLLGGELSILSKKGRGTQIIAEIPLV